MSHFEGTDDPGGSDAEVRAVSVSMSGDHISPDPKHVSKRKQDTRTKSSAVVTQRASNAQSAANGGGESADGPTTTTDVAPNGADVASKGADVSPSGVDVARKCERVLWARGATKRALSDVIPDTLWINMETHPLGMASCVVDADLEADGVKELVEQCTLVLDVDDVVMDARLPGTFVAWPKRTFRDGRWAVASTWSQDSSANAVRGRLKKACGKGAKYGLQLRFGRPALLVQCAQAPVMVKALEEARKADLEVEVVASPAAASLWLELTAPAHVSSVELSTVLRAQRRQLAERYPGCVFGEPDTTFIGHRCLVTIFTTIDVASQYSMVVNEVRVRFVVPGETSSVPRPTVLKANAATAATTVAAAVKKRLATQVRTATGVKVRGMGDDGGESDSTSASDESDNPERQAMEAAVDDVATAVKQGLETVLPTLAQAGVTEEERARLGSELGNAVPEGLGEALAFIEKWKAVHSASDVAKLLDSRGVVMSWAERLRGAPQPPPPSAWNRTSAGKKSRAGTERNKQKGAPTKGK